MSRPRGSKSRSSASGRSTCDDGRSVFTRCVSLHDTADVSGRRGAASSRAAGTPDDTQIARVVSGSPWNVTSMSTWQDPTLAHHLQTQSSRVRPPTHATFSRTSELGFRRRYFWNSNLFLPVHAEPGTTCMAWTTSMWEPSTSLVRKAISAHVAPAGTSTKWRSSAPGWYVFPRIGSRQSPGTTLRGMITEMGTRATGPRSPFLASFASTSAKWQPSARPVGSTTSSKPLPDALRSRNGGTLTHDAVDSSRT
mmetsp:Transcript_43543/g.103490  ORF Transcript_43543/g.103490 Transcript_43543/m.103490 type:complete len:252 (-) Transcript_43543:1753-2508(-)